MYVDELFKLYKIKREDLNAYISSFKSNKDSN